MPEIKRVSIEAVDIKMGGDDGAGEIAGYASTFGNFDDVGERVIKGAFAAHLPAFLKDGFIAVGHNWSTLPIATPIEANEDEHGLFVRAAFHSTPDAQHARTVIRERLERGKSVKLSIGYEVLADDYTDEGRLLKDVRLFEWSYVTVPANQMASVTGVKELLLEGGPLHAYADATEVALAAYVKALRALIDRRTKAGRMFSEANLTTMDGGIAAIAEGLATLQELRGRAQPPQDEPKHIADSGHVETRKLFLEWQRVRQQAAQLGVHQL